jgi:branched-chain amino acid transport system substrate-binding protein
MRTFKWLTAIAVGMALAASGLACGGGSSSTSGSTGGATVETTEAEPTESETTEAPTEDALGKPNKATGSPIVFAMIDDVGGPVSAPEAYQASQAGVDYVNEYLGGINGHPIKLEECSNATNTPESSATCANQLIAKDPTLVLGAVDTGAPGAFPVWESNHLPYVGGMTFTPVESNAPNAVIFGSINGGDNAAQVAYAHEALGAESIAVIEADDTQGLETGKLIDGVAENLGMSVEDVPLADGASASQLAAAAAQASAASSEFIYVETPAMCPQAVLAVSQTGYSGAVAALGVCASLPAVKTMGEAADGLILAGPYVWLDQIDSKEWGSQLATTLAAFEKYAPDDLALDSAAFGGFGSVMNIHETLDGIKEPLNEKTILAAFEEGSEHPNWLAHPYTCDHKQVPTQKAVCNPYQQIQVIEGGEVVTKSPKWVNGAQYIAAP